MDPVPGIALEPARLVRFAAGAADESLPAELFCRRGREAVVLRAAGHNASVAVKLWGAGGLRRALSMRMGSHSACREWRALRRLRTRGVRVLWLLASYWIEGRRIEFRSAESLEDLGPCVTALEHSKALRERGERERLWALEERPVELTFPVIESEVVDDNH